MIQLLVLIVSTLIITGTSWCAELGTARLSLVKGDVQVYTGADDEWFPATRNMILKEGDRIWVPEKARAEVHLLGGIYLRLDAQSSLDLLGLEEDSLQFSLQRGHAYINNRKGGIDHIQIETPVASVGCYDNSIVLVDVTERGETDLSVLKGYSQTETRNGRTRVAAGNILRVADNLDTEIFPLGKPDAWERWNHDRDERQARGTASLRYLPDELDDFAEELDENGSWSLVEEYGYVWTPRAAVTGADWAPYRSGRWIWVDDQFVWISYDPWGWAPHHYGRWAFIPARGWCWVPPPRNAVVWAPGYVGWTYTSSAVAWIPLAPGEAYHAQSSRDRRGAGTRQPPVRTGYRNISVRNSVTVISRDSFVSGRRGVVRVRGEELFRSDTPHAPPPFRPERSANAPVIRTISPERRPPVRIRQLSVGEIRQERRLQRDERGSVFAPGRAVLPLPVKERSQPPRLERPPQPPSGTKGQDRQGVRSERRGQQPAQRPAQAPAPARTDRPKGGSVSAPPSAPSSVPPSAPPAAVRPQPSRETGARQPPPRTEERAPDAEQRSRRPENMERSRRERD